MTRINLPAAFATTAAAALLAASGAMAQSGVATPKDDPGKTVTAPTTSAGSATTMPKMGDAKMPVAKESTKPSDSTLSGATTKDSEGAVKTLGSRDADARPTVDDKAADSTGTKMPLTTRDADGKPVQADKSAEETGTKMPLTTRDADGKPAKAKEGS